MYHSNWEEAAAESKYKLAVSAPKTINEKGMILQAEIIIGADRQPWWVVKDSPGIKIRRAKNREVDEAGRWRKY